MLKWIQSLFDRAVREEPLVLNTPVANPKAKPRAKAKTKTVKAAPSKTTRKKK